MFNRVLLFAVMFCLLMGGQVVQAQGPAKKTYDVPFMEKVPYGVTAWATSERVKKGIGKESRFVPYNSDSAKGFVNDVNLLREVYEASSADGKETSFYMAYDTKGWSIYIYCQRTDIEKFVDEGKDSSLELFFAPGQQNVPYYQLMITQLAGRVNIIDWGSPHKDYRSLSGSVKVESLALEDGIGTFIFVPWDRLYDQLPLNGDSWIFSFMRWDTSVTWGGNVHDTGNFGLVKFEKPSDQVALAIRSKMVRNAIFSFHRTSSKLTGEWGDEKLGDLDFNTQVLEPLVASYKQQIAALGDRAAWTQATLDKAEPLMKNWAEFDYVVADAREAYLRARHLVGQPAAAGTAGDRSLFRTYPIKALTAIKRLPSNPGEKVELGHVISVVAAKGEFEPASFLISAGQNVPAVQLDASDLVMGSSKIPAENVDIKIVKVWYQGGTAWYSYFADPNRRELTPELFLNDETLVKVDRNTQENYLRVGNEYRWMSYPKSKDEEFGKFDHLTESVQDSKTLQPIEIIKDEYKQIWVTVKVPADAKEGLYQGKINFQMNGQQAGDIRLTVKVLPYELPMPRTYYDLDKEFLISMYGAEVLRLGEARQKLTPEALQKLQMAMYRNVLDHNVYNNRSSLQLGNRWKTQEAEDLLRTELRWMKKAGFPMKPLIAGGWAYPLGNGEAAELTHARLDKYVKIVEEEVGHRDIYLQTWDEASTARVKVYREVSEYLHSKGLKLWATTHIGRQFPMAGYTIDLANNGGAFPSRDEAARWHALGAKVATYATPHLGVENPEITRRGEGMARYKANYDASFNYQYMSSEGNPNIWNEANARTFRSFCMVYPTTDDVIDTLAWEGFREGIDDIRYATKLKQDAAAAIASNYYPAVLVAKKALLWLEVTDDKNVDLNTMRLEMINQIEKIAASMKELSRE